MLAPICRNKVILTYIHYTDKKQYAFGAVMEPKTRACFFPHWIVKAFDLRPEDQGKAFDCLFVDQSTAKEPMVIAVIRDGDLQPSIEIGKLHGWPGTDHAVAKIEDAAGANQMKKLGTLTLNGVRHA